MLQRALLFYWALILVLFAKKVYGRELAPVIQPQNADIIPDQYIVVLKKNAIGVQSTNFALTMHKVWLLDMLSMDPSSHIIHFLDTFCSYAVKLSQSALEFLRLREEVDYIEQDQVVYIVDKPKQHFAPNNSKLWQIMAHKKFLFPIFARQKFLEKLKKYTTSTQTNAPWGLTRLSTKKISPQRNYCYPAIAGKNVDVYVLDTGVYVDHEEFEGRAVWGATIPKFDYDMDANGHGTHCAGTIAGKTYGVAKKANIIAIKVLRSNGFGSNSDVIKGVEWAINHHRSKGSKNKKSIASMSLGGSKSVALEMAISGAVRSGISFVVAAGNDYSDACEYSPAGSKDAVTVGAINSADEMAFFSNYGSCVDVFAPGVDIISSWNDSKTSTKSISGTSMATPHVAGVMALLLSDTAYTPKELKEILLNNSIKDILNGIPSGTTNNLANISELLQRISDDFE